VHRRQTTREKVLGGFVSWLVHITLSLPCGEQTSKKAGWSWGCVSAIDSKGRTIWIVDAHRGDGKRFVVRADEKLTAFLELERAVCIHILTKEPALKS
jgi:hypothetical protein